MKNVIEIHTEGKDPEPRSTLDEFCLAGAQRMLHCALEFEVAHYLDRHRVAPDMGQFFPYSSQLNRMPFIGNFRQRSLLLKRHRRTCQGSVAGIMLCRPVSTRL
jgi:hypothetical protein